MQTKITKRAVAIVLACSALVFLFPVLKSFASPSYSVPFNPNSIWNSRITPDAAVDPNSAAMIQLLAQKTGSIFNIDGVNDAWSVPIYYANPGTPLREVCDAHKEKPCDMVPIPDDILPSPDSDAKAVIIDLSSEPARAWSFWALTPVNRDKTAWTVGWGAFGWANTSHEGDGLRNYEGGQRGGRVTGWNYYAGLIHPEEIAQGRIDHALAFFIPRTAGKHESYVWPAQGTDGTSTNANAIPLGSRIQLDPSLNVETLAISPGAKVIARALQEYGGWIGDTGENAAVDAREFVTLDSNGQPQVDPTPWTGLLTSYDLHNFPMNYFRIIQADPSQFYSEAA